MVAPQYYSTSGRILVAPQPVGAQHAKGVNGLSARGENLDQVAAHGKGKWDDYTKDPQRSNPNSD